MKRFLRPVLIVLLAGGLLAGGYWLYTTRLAPQPETPETFTDRAVVKRGSLEVVVEAPGELNAVQSRSLTFAKLSGFNELTELNVAEGDEVRAGQVLAAVDPAPYRQTLEKARSELEAAEKRLAELQKPPSPSQVAQADLQVARAEQALAEAQAELARLDRPALDALRAAVEEAAEALKIAQLQTTLAEHGETAKAVRDWQYAVDWHGRRAVELKARVEAGQANSEDIAEQAAEVRAEGESRTRLAEAQAERRLALAATAEGVREAEAALATATKALAEAQSTAGATAAARLNRAKAELAIREAEVNLDEAKDGRARLEAGPDAQKVAAAKIEVEQRRLDVAQAEQALAGARLVAPFDGTVIAVGGTVGGYVEPSDVIAELADMERLQVRTWIDETSIRDIAEGQAAEVVFESLPKVTYAGRTGPVPLQGTVEQELTYYIVEIGLDGPVDETLRLNAPATVRIRTGRVEDGLIVPATAVQYEDGMTVVLLGNPADPEEAERIPVQTGVSDGTNIEILEGLEEGQTVLIPLRSNVPMYGGY